MLAPLEWFLATPLRAFFFGYAIVVLIVLLGATAALAEEPCLEAADHCWTEADYDAAYADPYATFDAMAYVFGVASEPLATPWPAEPRPSERDLGEGLVEETFTFAELIEQAEEASDNPAFR